LFPPEPKDSRANDPGDDQKEQEWASGWVNQKYFAPEPAF
jgi:hypothetical protein